jgi:hypothetical protein
MTLSSQALAKSATDLINQNGVKATITPLDGTSPVTTTCVFVKTTANPQTTGSAVQLQSRIVVPGRYKPNVGDFVNVNGTDFRIRTVQATYLKGKPIVFVLDLT